MLKMKSGQVIQYTDTCNYLGNTICSHIHKYDISRDDWNSPINILHNKIDLYSTQHTLLDDICVATSIRELCESRDSEYTNFFDRNESRKLIDFRCTTQTNSYSLLCLYLSAMGYPVIFTHSIYMCLI